MKTKNIFSSRPQPTSMFIFPIHKRLAKKQCANFNRGICISLDHKTKLENLPCYLWKNTGCTYFEKALLPLLQNARKCKCGKPLPKHKTYCAECSKKRRKNTVKRAAKRFRIQ